MFEIVSDGNPGVRFSGPVPRCAWLPAFLGVQFALPTVFVWRFESLPIPVSGCSPSTDRLFVVRETR